MTERRTDSAPRARASAAGRIPRLLRALELPLLLLVPATLLACAFFGVHQSALLSALVAVTAVVLLAAGFETSQPGLRQVLPAVVLGAVAAAGRIIFAPLPNCKPVSAVAIMGGAVFGRSCGFMVGAGAALVSNMFFGQGPWTPWQMYAWGLVGYLGGVFAEHGWMERALFRDAFALSSGLLYGAILDSWNLVGFVHPITWESALLNYGAGFALNLVHGIATVVFLRLIWGPWHAKLARVRRKYAARAA